jgi:WD40 repeat protein
VALGFSNETVGIIQALDENNQEIYHFKAHNASIIDLKYFPSGLLASVSFDFTVKVWNTTTWRLVHTHKHLDVVLGVEFLNGTTVASCSADKTIQIWSIGSNAYIRIPIGSMSDLNTPTALKLLPNNLLAMGDYSGNILIWRVSAVVSRVIGAHASLIYQFELVSDELLASSSGDKTIKIWNITTTPISLVFDLIGTDQVSTLKLVAPNLLASGENSLINLWDLTTRSLINSLTMDNASFVLGLDLYGQDKLVVGVAAGISYWNISSVNESVSGFVEKSLNTSFLGFRALASVGGGQGAKCKNFYFKTLRRVVIIYSQVPCLASKF